MVRIGSIGKAFLAMMILVILSIEQFSIIGQSDEVGSPIPQLSIENTIPSPRSKVQNPYIAHAEAGARWLISIANEPSPGVYKWYSSSIKNTDYYLEQSEGAVGIGKFFLQLYNVTGNTTYLDYAKGAGRWIISQAVTVSPDSCKWSYVEGLPYYGADYYGGQGSMVEYLLMLYQITGESTFLTYAKKGAEWLMDTAVPVGEGHKWELYPGGNYNMTGWYHGTAGLSFVFLELYQFTGNETYLDVCLKGARWLMDIARNPAPDQYAWVRVETDANPSIVWCGGTTGIVQFFLELYEAIGNTTHLDYARGGGNWLISQAVQVRPGNVSFIGTNMFCHGDPSSAWIMFRLYSATGNSTYRQYGEMTMNWIISQKEDLSGNRTTWASLPGGDEYNTGLMMGVSGIGHAFLLSHGLVHNRSYRIHAIKAANWVGDLAVEISPDMEKWNYMERIDSTEEYCTGWYWGVAGIGQFMLEVAPYWEHPPEFGIDITGERSMDVRPYMFNETIFTVENTGDIPFEPAVTVRDVLTGWDVNVFISSGQIAPGYSSQGRLSAMPSTSALAGETCNITILARCGNGSSVEDTITLSLSVLPVRNFSLEYTDVDWTIDAGESVRVPFQLTNRGSLPDNYTVRTKGLDDRWSFVDPLPYLNVLYPGQTLSTEFQVTLKEMVPAGEYHLDVNLSSKGNPSVFFDQVLIFHVGTVIDMRIAEPDRTVRVAQDLPVYVNHTIFNEGNVDLDVEISLNGSYIPDGWTLRFDDHCQIGPGNSTNVPIEMWAGGPVWHANLTITFDHGLGSISRKVDVDIDPLFGAEILDSDIIDRSPEMNISVYTLHIRNTGTAVDDIDVYQTSSGIPGWRTSVWFMGDNMEPGEVRTATVDLERFAWWAVFSAEYTINASSSDHRNRGDSIRIERTIQARGPHIILNETGKEHRPGSEAIVRGLLIWDETSVDDVTISATTSSGWTTAVVSNITDDAEQTTFRGLAKGDHRPFYVKIDLPVREPAGQNETITVTATPKVKQDLRTEMTTYIVVARMCSFTMRVNDDNVTVQGDRPAIFDITLENHGNMEFPVKFSMKSLSGPPGPGSDFRWMSLDTDELTNASATITPEEILLTNETVTFRLEIAPDPTILGTRYFQLFGRSETNTMDLVLTVVVEEAPDQVPEERSRGSIVPWILLGIAVILLAIAASVAIVRSILRRSDEGVWE